MILDKPIGLAVDAREFLATVGVFAQGEGKDQAALLAAQLAGAFERGATYMAYPRADMLLCALIDELRADGRADVVEKIEELIGLLKAGHPQRVIAGSISFDAKTIGQLDDQLERIHHVGARLIGG